MPKNVWNIFGHVSDTLSRIYTWLFLSSIIQILGFSSKNGHCFTESMLISY